MPIKQLATKYSNKILKIFYKKILTIITVHSSNEIGRFWFEEINEFVHETAGETLSTVGATENIISGATTYETTLIT